MKMQTLQFNQRMFALLGFSPNKPLWNREQCSGVVLMILSIPSFIIYAVNEANGDKELIDSVFISSVSIVLAISFLNTIYQRSNLYLICNLFDENINNREYIRSR